jgi:hypothetical protein
MPLSSQQFETLLLPACAWAEEQERFILLKGIPLSATQNADAESIGIAYPDKVRLLSVHAIPLPNDPMLREAAIATQLISPGTLGLTLRYGIFIRSDYWGDRALVFHELVHTLQYETLGGFMPFLRQYLHECITVGYPAAPMEQEAVTMTAALLA